MRLTTEKERARRNEINSQFVTDKTSSVSVTHHQNGVHFANESPTNGGVVECESLVGILGITAAVVHVIGRVSVSLVLRHESGLWRWLVTSSISRIARVLEGGEGSIYAHRTIEIICKLHSPEVDRDPDLEGRDSEAGIQA